MGTFGSLKRDHRTVLMLLRDGRPRTRVHLADATGWARNTVGLRLEELVEAGLVTSTDEQNPGRGRPAALYSLHRESRLLFVASFGLTHAAFAVTDLLGAPVVSESVALSIEVGPTQSLAAARDGLGRLITRSRVSLDSIGAVVVGLPSSIHAATGRPINPSIMPGWSEFDVAEGFGSAFGRPVTAENDANLMALGARVQEFPDASDLIFVKIASGVGAGIVSGGQLRRGARGMAGEIGHLPIPRGDKLCTCGNRGCVAEYATIGAVIRSLNDEGVAADSLADIVSLTRLGNPHCTRILRQAGRDLGEALVGLVAAVNPEVLILGGPLAAISGDLLAGAQEVVYARAQPALTSHLRMMAWRDHEEAALRGAAALGLDLLVERGDAHPMSVA